eukprot:3339996-Rhodomonas_salina.1
MCIRDSSLSLPLALVPRSLPLSAQRVLASCATLPSSRTTPAAHTPRVCERASERASERARRASERHSLTRTTLSL